MLLQRVGMIKDADRKAGTYSRGMKQRLGVADVLMKDPRIIIMDEPTLGIDPEGMRELLELISQLSKKDGRTLLISSHQLYQVQQICDRVGIFVNGSLVACGRIEELGRQIEKGSPYILELEIEPLDEEVMETLRQMEGVENMVIENTHIVIESERDIRPDITQYLGQNGRTILHMHQKGADLDEIYRRYFEKAGQSDESIGMEKKKRKNFSVFFGKKGSSKTSKRNTNIEN